jgi:hypothetical protein
LESLLCTHMTRGSFQTERPELLELRTLELERKTWKRGRRQAIDDAVMPMPGSTVDQIDTSVFLNRKSLPDPICQMKGILMIVAVDPLSLVSIQCIHGKR